MKCGFKAAFANAELGYFWVCFDVLRLALLKCVDLHYHQSVIAELAARKVSNMEKMEGIQKKQRQYRYITSGSLDQPSFCFWSWRSVRLVEISHQSPPSLFCSSGAFAEWLSVELGYRGKLSEMLGTFSEQGCEMLAKLLEKQR